MPDEPVNVFVSYSHADASLVAPLVRLLRVNDSLIFQDSEGIRPGKKWRDEIAGALARARLIVVFWCHHAQQSAEVAREWQSAIEQGKDVLPLLLDATPVPAELSVYQWIDFRATVGPGHDAAEVEAPERGAWPSLVMWPAGVAVALVAVWVFFSLSLVSGPGPGPWGGFVGWLAFVLSIAGVALIVYLVQTRISDVRRPNAPRASQLQHIADEVETEILRRTGAAQPGATGGTA